MKLQDYLEKHEMKAEQLAKKAGVYPSVLSRFLNGKNPMHPKNARKVSLATLGRVTIEELLYPKG